MAKVTGEWTRLEKLLNQTINDLKCVETKAAERYFRPAVDATIDPPFTGINKEAAALREKIEALKKQEKELR